MGYEQTVGGELPLLSMAAVSEDTEMVPPALTVRNAAKLAVYAEMVTSMKNPIKTWKTAEPTLLGYSKPP